VGGEARTLELACTLWAATSRLGVDSEDDEEVAARNTLERGMTWACRAFDELILLTTSVSFFLSKIKFSIPWSSQVTPRIFILLAADPRVFRSETCPRGTQTSRGADSARDATRRGSGGGGWCRGERDVRVGVP
jgi:hypothetical protein